MNNENWIVDGKVGTVWIVRDLNRTDLLAPIIRVGGPITLAQRIAELLNKHGSKP